MSVTTASAANALECLQAPAEDGGVLLVPALVDWPAVAQANHRAAQRWRFDLLDVDIQTARADVRRALLGREGKDSLILALGHQPDFVHPGVWAKDVATHQAAVAAGGQAVYLIADSNTLQEKHLRVPHMVGDHLQVAQIAIPDQRGERLFEDMAALTGEQVTRLRDDVRQALGDPLFDVSSMPAFLDRLRSVPAGGRWVDQMTAGRRVFDDLAQAKLLDRPVSRVWNGPLAVHLLLDAERFARAYNQALAEHRRQHGIRGNRHPIPDLEVAGDGFVESPMWHYEAGQPRRRLFVRQHGDRVTLRTGNEDLVVLKRGELAGWSQAQPRWSETPLRRLRPRALTLTLWARLLACDLFVHGIGGALYDTITDRIMADYFGVDPPGFACASATLRLEFPARTVSDAALAGARRRVRDVRFNPQRYLSAPDRLAPLLSERQAAIAQAQRFRQQDRRNRPARRAAFLCIRAANQQILAAEPSLAARLAAELEELRRRSEHQRLATARDYFVGLFGRSRLVGLAERVRRGG